jgi:iron-desferrioxamine transport system substrate-binding protein
LNSHRGLVDLPSVAEGSLTGLMDPIVVEVLGPRRTLLRAPAFSSGGGRTHVNRQNCPLGRSSGPRSHLRVAHTSANRTARAMDLSNSVTRREFLGVAASGAVVVLAGRLSSSVTKGSTDWSFTDDRGVKVSLATQPKRIVAYDQAASALMNIGVPMVGIMASMPFGKDPLLTGLNLSGVAKVSQAYGDINLEVLAAAQPDLIVTELDPRLTGPLIGFTNKSTQDQAQQVAPIVAIDYYTKSRTNFQTGDVIAVTNRFEQLGRALGANLQAPDVVAAQKNFEQASARVRAATAAKPGLKVIALGAYVGVGIQVARPQHDPTLLYYQELGVDMVEPGGSPGNINKNYNNFFFELLSYERASQYPADLILYDDTVYAMSLQSLDAIPTWKDLPAVKAGQIIPWRKLNPFSFKVEAVDLGRLATAINKAKIVT